MALAGVMLALGVFQKGHCVVKGWANPDQFWRACYSDLPVLHVTTGLADRQLPYAGTGSDQPLLSGLVMWLLARITPQAGTGVGAQQWIFALWAALALLLVATAVLAGIALLPHDPWHLAHLAASPVLVVLALISTDLVGVALVMWAWWAWTRERPALAGVLVGLAFLVRPFPLVFLLAMVLVALRDGRTRAAATAVVAAMLGALALYVPALLFIGDGVLAAPRGWWAAGPGYGAPALLPQLFGLTVPAPVTTGIALAGWVLALAIGAWFALRSFGRPDTVQVAAVMLLVVALTAKSLSVQSGLWLLPLLALSGLRWRDHLIWAGAEIIHFEATWLHIGFGSDAGKGLPPETYGLAILLRLSAWAWVLGMVWLTPSRGRRPPEPAPRHTAGGGAEISQQAPNQQTLTQPTP
nr:glycosyltransferase family 87 protein [Ornithinimicrobium sp. HY1793]